MCRRSNALLLHMIAMKNIAVCAYPASVNGKKDYETYVQDLMVRLGLDGLAYRLADRVVDGGTSLQMGTPAKVFGQPRNARVAHAFIRLAMAGGASTMAPRCAG